MSCVPTKKPQLCLPSLTHGSPQVCPTSWPLQYSPDLTYPNITSALPTRVGTQQVREASFADNIKHGKDMPGTIFRDTLIRGTTLCQRLLHYIEHRVHTEWQWPLSGVHPLMRVKSDHYTFQLRGQITEHIKGQSKNRGSVSALLAGAYTTTVYVMADIVKGGGRAPPSPQCHHPHQHGLFHHDGMYGRKWQ